MVHFTDSNRARLRYIKEDPNTWGTTPVSGKTRELRFTGSTINANKSTAVSEEIRADRMTADYIETGANTAGDTNVEFSAGSHDDLLEAAFYGAWSRPMTFDSVKGVALEWADTDTLYVKGADVTDYFTAGHRVKTDGFVGNNNNDYWEIATIVWNSGASRTEINMTASTATAEAGSAYTSLYDANDVIVLKNTTLRFGTGGASTIDSNGGNAFAAAIAAGQLVAGQKIFVDGLGIETGSVAFTGNPAAGSKVTVSDGDKAITFQFGGSYPTSVKGVDLGSGNGATAENFKEKLDALRLSGDLNVSATISGTTVTIKNLHRTGGSIVENLDSGNAITVTQFANGDDTLHGIFKLTSATDDVLTVSPHPATNANSGSKAITIKGSMLRNPSNPSEITPQSFTFETGLEDSSQFFTHNGLRVSTFSYNIASQSILTGSFGFMGAETKRFGVTQLGTTPYDVLATTSTPVANATVNVGQIKLNAGPLSTAVQSITLNHTNNLRDQNAVGHKFPAGIGAGRFEVTGNLVAYFADGSLWDTFIEHRTVSIEFPITDVLGNHYEFTIPAANFNTDTANPAGGNQDILENIEFGAKRDPASACEMQIDRFSSINATTA